jgi:hypothetical protein
MRRVARAVSAPSTRGPTKTLAIGNLAKIVRRCIEAVLGAQLGDGGVGEIAFGGGEQALDAGRVRFKPLQPVYRQQVFQGHQQSPL